MLILEVSAEILTLQWLHYSRCYNFTEIPGGLRVLLATGLQSVHTVSQHHTETSFKTGVSCRCHSVITERLLKECSSVFHHNLCQLHLCHTVDVVFSVWMCFSVLSKRTENSKQISLCMSFQLVDFLSNSASQLWPVGPDCMLQMQLTGMRFKQHESCL